MIYEKALSQEVCLDHSFSIAHIFQYILTIMWRNYVFLLTMYMVAFYYNIIVFYLLSHWSFICNFNICVLTGRKDSTLMKWWQLILLKSSGYLWCPWSSFSWSFSLSLSPHLSLSLPVFSSSSLVLPLSWLHLFCWPCSVCILPDTSGCFLAPTNNKNLSLETSPGDKWWLVEINKKDS